MEMGIIAQAEAVIGSYTARRLAEALYSQQVCGCRACTARASVWLDWAIGDDDIAYDDVHISQSTSASSDGAALAS